MAKLNWTEITREDVIKAIEKFLAYNVEYPEPRTTFLVYDGSKLPAKHIRGMAYQEHYGISISKSDFSGGIETVRFFERLGFEVAYHGTSRNDTKTKKKKFENVVSVASSEKVISAQPEDDNRAKKITISAKSVIEQKNALQLILNKMFEGDIVCEKTYPWLITPQQLDGDYKKLYDDLVAYRGDVAFAKKGVKLRCDFVCESKKLIIEYDERQHFSEARKISLEAYKGVPVNFDRSLWIRACQDINAKDNSPYNRDEIRAYYDSVRDIACYEHGYRLVRIMHGQIDFESENAESQLKTILGMNTDGSNVTADKVPIKNDLPDVSIKIAMYLQTNGMKNQKMFKKIIPVMKNSDADIVVFPEYCYVPFMEELDDYDIFDPQDQQKIFEECLNFSEALGKAVIINSADKYNTIYNVYANASPEEGETELSLYIKHTMCGSSCLEFDQYPDMAGSIFDPILYKGFLIGMTICYDCNHALFSRIYGLYGIDIIINSTGGNVVYDKWFKYNKVRAIENECNVLVTMGGNETPTNNNYVFGFNKNGGQLQPTNLCGDSSVHNLPGGLYVYEISRDAGIPEEDNSNQIETENKNWDFEFPVLNSSSVLDKSIRLRKDIYLKPVGNTNIFFLIIDGEDIMKPEKVQQLLYANILKQYRNRRYIIINRHDEIDSTFFKEKLSVILKVRAMENFCAVILESDNINKCYQCGKNRTAQVVKETDGCWRIDLERTSGPEVIWKNKSGMRASWRNNYEWLVENSEKLYDEW